MVLAIRNKCHQCFCGSCVENTLQCNCKSNDSPRILSWNYYLLIEISYQKTNQSNRRNIAEIAKRYLIWPDQSLQNHSNPKTMQNLQEKYTVQVPKMQRSITFRQRCSLFWFVSWKFVTSGHLWAMFSKCGFFTFRSYFLGNA